MALLRMAFIGRLARRLLSLLSLLIPSRLDLLRLDWPRLTPPRRPRGARRLASTAPSGRDER